MPKSWRQDHVSWYQDCRAAHRAPSAHQTDPGEFFHSDKGEHFRTVSSLSDKSKYPLCLWSQEERSRSEHNLLNIQKTHERMQTENKSQSPCCQLFISQCSSAAVLWVLIHSDLLSCPSVSHSVPILPDQAERTVHHGQGWCWGGVQVRRGLKCWEKIMILIWLRLLSMKQKYLVYFHLHSSDSSWEPCRVTFFCSFVCILTWLILFRQH